MQKHQQDTELNDIKRLNGVIRDTKATKDMPLTIRRIAGWQW